MGLFTGLLTVPLAQVRGVVWIAERLREEAVREVCDPELIRRRLTEVAEVRVDGRLEPEEADRLEEELVGRPLDTPPGGPGGRTRP